MFTGVIDTGRKFINGVVVTGDHFSSVLATLVINLSPVSTTPPINPWQKINGRCQPPINLSAVSSTPLNSLSLVSLTALINLHSQLSRRIFEKCWNDPNGILTGPGDTDSWKKTEVKNPVSDTLWNNLWLSGSNTLSCLLITSWKHYFLAFVSAVITI
jgi:hypothetical protein